MPSTTAGWWQQRRFVVLAIAVVAAVAISLIATQQQGRATSGATPYDVPNVVDVNSDPDVVETTIVADEANVNIGNGVTAHAQTFNGTIPGPTFHLKVNDVVIVHFENHLDKPTAIHWHGIELPNSMDGTPFTQNQVEPGGSFLYKFAVTRPGLYWYHPHHHSSTNQVFRGLYGMIIVTDPNEAPLQQQAIIPSAADTHPVVLSDVTVCHAKPNDSATYASNAPHVSGASPFPAQMLPAPLQLCDVTNAPTHPVDEDGADRGDYAPGDIPAIQLGVTRGRTNEGQTVLTNGKNVGGRGGTPAAPGALAPGADAMDVQARQGVRLQFVNAAAIRYFRLRLTTSTGVQVPLTRIGGEGGLLDNAVDEGGHAVGPDSYDTKYETGEILLPPGTRADVAFGIPANATGVLTLWTEDFKRTGRDGAGEFFFANTATVPVMHFRVNGSAPSTFDIAGGDPLRTQTGNLVETLGAANGTLLNPNTFTPSKLGMASQNIQLGPGTDPKDNLGSLGINNVFGTHDVEGDYAAAAHLGSSRYAKQGDRLQLTVENTTGAHHPFHLHGFSIQPISLVHPDVMKKDFTWPYREFRDNVDVPPGYTLTFRIRLDPRPMSDGTTAGGALGRWVFHCHIFFHANNGMLGEVVVTAPNGKERPDVNVDASSTTAEQDQTASIGGTFSDRDGEAVTLTASTGSLTQGAGKWTWTKPTSASDGGGIVFITATDAGGLKDQVAFQLNVTNTPPALVVPGPQGVAIGKAHTVPISADDPNTSDTIALGASGLPSGLSFTDNHNRTGVVSGTVTAPPGVYVTTFSADDGKHAPVTSDVTYTVTASGKLLTGIVNRPEVIRKKSIVVGCRLVVPTVKSCRATVMRKGKVVGQKTKSVPATGTILSNVTVALKGSLRRAAARSIPGVPVSVQFLATSFNLPGNLTDTRKTRVVAPRVVASPKFDAFKPGSAKTTKRGKRFLVRSAKQVKVARRITCTARPEPGGAKSLAKARAATACALMKKAGLKAKFKRVGKSAPANRRVTLTISR
jgi:FtsP/CotA-like multicopper oxidase with cupredoxin domain